MTQDVPEDICATASATSYNIERIKLGYLERIDTIAAAIRKFTNLKILDVRCINGMTILPVGSTTFSSQFIICYRKVAKISFITSF